MGPANFCRNDWALSCTMVLKCAAGLKRHRRVHEQKMFALLSHVQYQRLGDQPGNRCLCRFVHARPLDFERHLLRPTNCVSSFSWPYWCNLLCPARCWRWSKWVCTDCEEAAEAGMKKCNQCKQLKTPSQLQVIGTSYVCQDCREQTFSCRMCRRERTRAHFRENHLSQLQQPSHRRKTVTCIDCLE